MRRLIRFIAMIAVFICLTLLSCGALAQGRTRALLVACSDFVSQPDLGSSVSGNLHMIGSALISADVRFHDLSIEDGTIGTVDALSAAVSDAFHESSENDLSILYLCTHGVLSSSDDEQVYLLLGDGTMETPMNSAQLYALLEPIQGEKLLILDACHSGALIGRGMPETIRLPGSHPTEDHFLSPFLTDSSIHVLTSSSGRESSWYYDSERLSTGAVSYFASALACGLGLYGTAEADMNADGSLTLAELHRYLSVAVPSSSSQLLSTSADQLILPISQSAMLSRPLCGFSYGASLLPASDPTLDFSFTVTREASVVQYRLVEYIDGAWDWANAKTFLDDGDSGDTLLSSGRKTRSLTLDGLDETDSGYLMLQVFSVSDNELLLCSERLLAVQPGKTDAQLTISVPSSMLNPGMQELAIDVFTGVPAELTVSIFDSDGALVRRLTYGQLTSPTPENVAHLYWDGRDDQGESVELGLYTVAAEARIGAQRQKAAANVMVGS